MITLDTETSREEESAWAPFRSRVFAIVWMAVMLGNIGTWIRDVGAGWLMTTLSASATAVAMVQVATTLPIFLFSLSAGALADIVNRRRLLIAINAASAAVMLGMAGLTHAGLMTPEMLLCGLTLAGVGTALTGPVLQSLTPLLVPQAQLGSAVALNSLGLNVSRAIGPAIGGVLLGFSGVAMNFAADALSYLAVIAAFWWWRASATPASSVAPEQLGSAIRAGIRFALHAPALQRVLLRAGSFFIFASAYWALLPLIARRELGGGPSFYGFLLSCVGAGAVASAICLPRLRKRLGGESVVRLGTLAAIAVLVTLALTKNQVIASAAMVLAGAAWIAVLTTANVSAQVNLPNWVRGRGLALYLTVFYGVMTVGSFLWGQIADRSGVPAALLVAAILGVFAMILAWLKPLPEGQPDLMPSRHWADPELTTGMAVSLVQDRGPVLVTVEYCVDPACGADFLMDLRAFSSERLRDGAYRWGVFEDSAQRGHFFEHFLLPSWREHQRQHERVSKADAELQAKVHAHHIGAGPPKVQHFIAPAVEAKTTIATSRQEHP